MCISINIQLQVAYKKYDPTACDQEGILRLATLDNGQWWLVLNIFLNKIVQA